MENVLKEPTLSSLQLVELKNGETYNGHLVSCDNWMNINLREVICTSRVKLRTLKSSIERFPVFVHRPAFLCLSQKN